MQVHEKVKSISNSSKHPKHSVPTKTALQQPKESMEKTAAHICPAFNPSLTRKSHQRNKTHILADFFALRTARPREGERKIDSPAIISDSFSLSLQTSP